MKKAYDKLQWDFIRVSIKIRLSIQTAGTGHGMHLHSVLHAILINDILKGKYNYQELLGKDPFISIYFNNLYRFLHGELIE